MATTSNSSGWTLARWVVVVAGVLPVLSFLAFTGLAWLQFGPVPYLVAFGLVGVALVAWRPAWWAYLVAGLGSLVMVGLNAPFLGPEMVRPDHYPEYAVVNVIVLGGLASLIASVVGLVQARRGTAAPARWGAPPAAAALLVAGVILGAVIAGVEMHNAPVAGAGTVLLTPQATASTTEKDDAFTPATVSIPAGKIVKLSIANDDPGQHNFKVDDLSIMAETPSGKTTDVWLQTDKTGTYQFYCSIHSSQGDDGKWEGMVGTLTVG